MNTIEKVTTTDKIVKLIGSVSFPLWGEKERGLALEAFAKQGIPNRKNEEYKYANIDLILKDNFSLSTKKTISCEQIKHFEFLKNAIVIVIENGVFIEGLSNLQNLPNGLTICSLADAFPNNSAIFSAHFSNYAEVNSDAFVALNTALAIDGVFIHIAKETVVTTPIHILHISTTNENLIINPRNLIVVEKHAQAKFVESFETVDSKAKTFNNALTELVVGENAIVEHYKIQDEKEPGYLVNTTQVIQKKGSVFSSHNFTLSGSLVRNNLNIVLDAENSETHLYGLYVTDGNQVVDNHTIVDHRKPNCTSNEIYKGIIDGKSSATFNGKIVVRKNAQKTSAFQSNKNILLSDEGTINTKPQLEIYADDVKCSHGTSTGKIDADKIFYLRARGLSEASAKKMLMYAFASEIVNTVKIDDLRNYLEEKISKRFE